MESKEGLMKLLDEPGEMNSHQRHAWKAEGTQETQNFMVIKYVNIDQM